MKVVIAGGHGKIALRLTRLLRAGGDEVVSLIRDPAHAAEVHEAGSSAVICDLEHTTVEQVARAIDGSDAVVFAAGVGPGSGAERKLTLDRDGAIKLIHAATSTGISRYVMVSSVGAENPPSGDDVFEVYLRAKADADAALEASGLEWTILRPGGLTEDAGTGRIRLGTSPFRGSVPRDDVAAVLVRLLNDSRLTRQILYLSSGSASIDEALDRL